MSIDWINFTPWTSLAGGALIGWLLACLFSRMDASPASVDCLEACCDSIVRVGVRRRYFFLVY